MIPKRIPINREAGYHTEHIGKFRDGQYMGFIFFLETGQTRLIAVLHLFDKAGAHLESKSWDTRAGAEPEKALVAAISALPEAKPDNISVQLFTITLLEHEFGLKKIDSKRVAYVPYGLAFFAPWTGNYST